MSSSSSSAGKLKKLKINADGEVNSSAKHTKHNKMNVEGGGGGAGSSSVGAGIGASATRPQQQQPATNNDSATVQPALHLSSDEVNYLIFRYLQESGFVHSSFTFVYESMLGRSNMRNSERSIPPGALISFLQKGLQYVGIEETLRREQQRGNGSNSNKRSKTGNNSNSSSSSNVSTAGGASQDVALNLSLLSPTTINALTRENPPLHLNVPPATAAAAVRARLEAEAQIEADRKKIAIMEAQEKAVAQSNGKSSTRLTGPQSIPPQTDIQISNPLANSVPSSMNMQAAQAAAAMNQLQQQQHHHLLPQNSSLTQQQQKQVQSRQLQKAAAAESAGAAALLAQQRISEIAVLEEQHRQQLQIQLREQEKMHLQKLHQETLSAAAQAQARNPSGHNPMDTISGMNTAQAQEAAILASVAEQMGNNMNNNSNNNNTGSGCTNNSNNKKRPSSAKKGLKNKGKSSKQQRTVIASQQQHTQSISAPTQQSEAMINPPISLSSNPPLVPPQNSGFASLEEAVARLEAGTSTEGTASKHQQQYQQQRQRQQDVVMNDARHNGAVGEESDHHPHHRHLQHRHNNLLNHMQMSASSHTELSSQQAAAVQELMTMNGKHVQGERHNFNGGTEQQQQMQNGALSAQNLQLSVSAQQQQQAVAASAKTSQIAPKEAAKAVDALIDREDELTNAKVSEVLDLKMHQSEVFMCAWNSVFTDMIATGSGDASARIWQMGGPKASNGLGPVKLLPHGTGPRDRKNKDVTTLEWSSDGKLLATGSYDGVARVWSLNGSLVHTLRGHKGPIFSLKWNKTGNYLLSGSYDKTTIVWDVSSGSGFIKQQFEDHQAPALDVDWKDDSTFASCSTDKTVHICRVGAERPLKTYTGHTDEVNAVKWDPSGSLLASCSDDCTAKVWDVNSDRKDPMYDFKSHQQEIYTVKWAPTGPGSKNPDKKPLLATASFDGSVRLWNVQDGTCIQVFSRHRDSVYSVAFSPSGNYLASGSLAGQLYIWNVMEGRHIKSFKGRGDIFEVAWNKEETRVAACFSSNVVCILDFP